MKTRGGHCSIRKWTEIYIWSNFLEFYKNLYCCHLGRTHFLFSFLSRQVRGERKQVLCRIFISEIETRPHQGSLWSECINGSSHISSELFLGVLNHKYESHYCVWMEIFYGLRLVSLIGLVRKLLSGGWEEGTHEAPSALQPNNKRKKEFVGSRGLYLLLATWHGSKMKSKFKFSRNIAKLAMDHRSLEPKTQGLGMHTLTYLTGECMWPAQGPTVCGWQDCASKLIF